MGQQCTHTVQQVQQAISQTIQEPSFEEIKIQVDLMRNKNKDMIQYAKKYISPDQKEQFLGYIQNGMKQGYGQLKVNNQKRYYGYFKDNLPHIKGILIFSNDHYYIGQFENGKMHGKGKQVSPFFTFEGTYQNDMKKYGKLISQEFTYQGSFQNQGNNLGGYGELHFKNGQKYTGYFEQGQFSGQGLYYDSDNTLIYEGHFQNNVYDGFGKYYWEDGSYYEGGYKDGLKHGEGKYIKEGEIIINGIWEQGQLTSRYKDSSQQIRQSSKMNKSNHSTKMQELY